MAISLKNHDDRIKVLESKIGSSTSRVLIERKSSGVKWYEKYSDGYIVQGVNSTSYDRNGLSDTFLISFSDTGYNIQGSIITNSNDAIRFYSVRTNGFSLASSGGSGKAAVIAFGY